MDKEVTSVIEGAVAAHAGWTRSRRRPARPEPRHGPVRSVDRHQRRRQRPARRGRQRQRNLPDDADPPTIVKADTNADAIMRLAVTSPTHADRAADPAGQRHHRRPPAAVEGVADVQVNGDRDPLVRVIIDPMRLPPVDLTSPTSTRARHRRARRAGRQSRDTNPDDARPRRRQRQDRRRDRRHPHQGDDPGRRRRRRGLRPGRAHTSLAHQWPQTGVGLGIVRQASSNTLDYLERRARGDRRTECVAAQGRHAPRHLG